MPLLEGCLGYLNGKNDGGLFIGTLLVNLLDHFSHFICLIY